LDHCQVNGNIGAILYGSTLMRIWFDKIVELSSISQINPLQNPAYLHYRHMLIIGTINGVTRRQLVTVTKVSKFKRKRHIRQVPVPLSDAALTSSKGFWEANYASQNWLL